jgi:hypothetical protein
VSVALATALDSARLSRAVKRSFAWQVRDISRLGALFRIKVVQRWTDRVELANHDLGLQNKRGIQQPFHNAQIQPRIHSMPRFSRFTLSGQLKFPIPGSIKGFSSWQKRMTRVSSFAPFALILGLRPITNKANW